MSKVRKVHPSELKAGDGVIYGDVVIPVVWAKLEPHPDDPTFPSYWLVNFSDGYARTYLDTPNTEVWVVR